jgi:hypothetical protein
MNSGFILFSIMGSNDKSFRLFRTGDKFLMIEAFVENIYEKFMHRWLPGPKELVDIRNLNLL